MSKLKIEDIQSALNEQGWNLVSTNYVNLDTEMCYECPEGHRVFAPWKKMRNRFECPICDQNALKSQGGEVIAKPKGATRVLALDQASKTSGYSIFDDGKLVKYGTYTVSQADEIERCAHIKSWMISLINNWKPDYIGLEGIQFQEESNGRRLSVTVFQTLARLQGILMETCHELKIPYEVIPTNTWRHTCGVKGRSRTDKKRSMQLLVKEWYDVSVTDDESDAIGIGKHMVSVVKKNTEVENWE